MTVMFPYERDMREPVLAWLHDRRLLTAVEFFIWHTADIVAGRFGARPSQRRRPPLLESYAVELKLSRVAEVIHQAKTNRSCVVWSYAAMPEDRCNCMRQDTLEKFAREGIGLLAVGAVVYVKIGALRSNSDGRRICNNLWRRVRKQYNTEHAA